MENEFTTTRRKKKAEANGQEHEELATPSTLMPNNINKICMFIVRICALGISNQDNESGQALPEPVGFLYRSMLHKQKQGNTKLDFLTLNAQKTSINP